MTDTPDNRSLVVLLHGVGASGADLEPLGALLKAALPGTVFVSPDAPEPFDDDGSRHQWFSLTGVTASDRPQRVAAARAGFDRTVTEALDRHGFDGRLDRVALVGFSQGATMTLDAVATGRWPVAGAVAFSGRLSSPEPLAPAPLTPVLIVHGEEDGVVPVTETFHAAAVLQGLGVALQTLVLPNIGHAIAPAAAALAGTFLERVFRS